MCSEYSIKTSQKKLESTLKTQFKNVTGAKTWDQKVKMSLKAPLIEMQNNDLVLTEGVFPTPPPFPNSRLSDLKINRKTGEEELVRIYDVPAWKEGFSKAPCLIPMSHFVEPVYWGDDTGKAMQFTTEKDPLLFCAGLRMIRASSSDKTKTGFSLITHTASKQMLNYHHRLIFLLQADHALDWITLEGSPLERFEFLLKHRYIPKFKIETDRIMAKKPKSRIEEQKIKLDIEMKYVEFLKTEGISG
ncbi:MAG: SOS response-associated peptidase family protein [Bdellovibrionaceae bacterium]|nr:SOS response-associated peptidase family protein [Bdellovibrio sp.]